MPGGDCWSPYFVSHFASYAGTDEQETSMAHRGQSTSWDIETRKNIIAHFSRVTPPGNSFQKDELQPQGPIKHSALSNYVIC